MNGSSELLFRNSYTSPKKHKATRTLEDQQFDYVACGIPLDKLKPSNTELLKDSLNYEQFKKTGKLLSEDDLEKQVAILHGEDYYDSLDQSIAYAVEVVADSNIEINHLENNLQSENTNPNLTNVLSSSTNKRKQEIQTNETGAGKRVKENTSVPVLRKNQKIQISVDENTAPSQSVDGKNSSALRTNKQILSGNCILKENVLRDNSPSTNFSSNKESNVLRETSNEKVEGSEEIPKTTSEIQTPFIFEEYVSPDPMMGDYPDDQLRNYLMNGGCTYDYIATLINMGNTCYMNSVLYALRFTPTFSHNLHHLIMDIYYVNNKLKENRNKTSSLGRNGSEVRGNHYRSSSSKDLLSIGNNDVVPKLKDQIVAEKLHDLFRTLTNLESRDSPEPYQPEALLQAIRDAKQLFEGNQQQDAHEFFMELLSCVRTTYDKLMQQIDSNPDIIKPTETASSNLNNSKIWPMGRSWKKPLKKKDKAVVRKDTEQENEKTKEKEPNESNDLNNGDIQRKKIGYNFIAEEFEGVSIHRTMCWNCEEKSELKEPFLEIQVPVNNAKEDIAKVSPESVFGMICVTAEKLCDQDKYFCENCNAYCEAVREVLYEKLPNILVFHLKRFMTTYTSVQKVNTFAPTPLEIRCFCESCHKIDSTQSTPHKYKLYCVIMHLGASMASGHYITYARLPEQTYDYTDCTRNTPKEFQTRDSSGNILKFLKSKTLGNSLNGVQNGLGLKKNDIQICSGMQCCGVKSKLHCGSLNNCGSDEWFEFDDEKARILSSNQFIDILNKSGENTNTPYVLFYSKV